MTDAAEDAKDFADFEPKDVPRGGSAVKDPSSLGVEIVDSPILFTKEAPTVKKFKDHFTLNIPSSTIRYRDRNAAARVIEEMEAQFVIEETNQVDESGQKTHQIEIRRILDASEGVRFLRIGYALVTAFWTGFLFVFCLQVLLFLVLDLAIEMGATSKGEQNLWKAFGALLAMPTLVYGLSSAMVIAGSYIMDTIRGHYLIRNFAFRSIAPVTVEWMFFCFFLGFPSIVMCLSLLSRSDSWWEITLLFWFSCILAFFCIFCFNVIWYEFKACWEVIRNRYNDDNDGFFHVLRICILLRQVATYSAKKSITYISYGSIIDAEATDKAETRANMIPQSYEEKISWFAKTSMYKRLIKWGWFIDLAGREERYYKIDDVRDVRPYVTSYTWNLEKIFCRRKNSRYIMIVKGPGAVTREQMRSSLFCSIIGSCLIAFLVFSILYYLGMGVVFSMFGVAIGILIFYPSIRSTVRLYRFGRDWKIIEGAMSQYERDSGTDRGLLTEKPSEAVYFVEERYRITRPSKRFVMTIFAVEVFLFFVYPVVSLFAVDNYPLAIIFIVVSGISMLRYYVNAAIVLEETGHMNVVDGKSEKEIWKNQSRLNEIIGNITRGRSRGMWLAVLGTFGFVFVALFLGAVGTEVDSLATFDLPFTYTDAFYYEQKDSLRYPTCQLTSDLGEKNPLQSMADYAFLAGLAYRGTNVTQRELDGWFQGAAVDRDEVVAAWDGQFGSAVSFKLVSFPANGNFSFLLIRGTTNHWDMLTDAQLWSAAFLMQGLRELLPLGAMWTPIIDELIHVITKLETESIARVSFYKDTTAFIRHLQNDVPRLYSGLGITGHSLGGGLSIITGAQTGVPAVALSGPNAMLSRKSFDPPVTADDLDRHTFNIIPERDVVPMIDDPAQNYQKIRCETDLTDVVGCHDSTRSLCEIIYTCGSSGRPFLCECVTQYNYPEPKLRPEFEGSNITFAEVCIRN